MRYIKKLLLVLCLCSCAKTELEIEHICSATCAKCENLKVDCSTNQRKEQIEVNK